MSNHEIDHAALVFRALSNPHRLTLFLELANCLGDASLDINNEGIQQCQFQQANHLGLAPSTISHHYKELRNSGLIRMERHGKSIRCSIDQGTLELVQKTLGMPSRSAGLSDGKE